MLGAEVSEARLARGRAGVATAEPGDDAVGADSRRLRGGGIEQLLPERGRRYDADFRGGPMPPYRSNDSMRPIVIDNQTRGDPSERVVDCRRTRVAPLLCGDATCRRGGIPSRSPQATWKPQVIV
jgi:hypothetical protein